MSPIDGPSNCGKNREKVEKITRKMDFLAIFDTISIFSKPSQTISRQSQSSKKPLKQSRFDPQQKPDFINNQRKSHNTEADSNEKESKCAGAGDRRPQPDDESRY